MRIFAFLYVLMLATGCAARPDIAVDYDADHDFSGYKTFVWMGEEPLKVEGDLRLADTARFAAERAIREEMVEKGYVEVQNPDEADFGVSAVVRFSQTVVIDSMDRTVYAASDRSARRVNGPGPLPDAVVVERSQYERVDLGPLAHMMDEGQLVIRVYDLGSGNPVWSVSATKDFTNDSPDGSNADSALRRLLRDFPPS